MLLCAGSRVTGIAAGAPVILILGDSMSAGYGLPTGHCLASPAAAATRCASAYPYSVVNASISGDTTAGGRARLDALLAQHRPAITVIELGGNDGLRGGSIDAMRQNLDAMAAAAQKVGSRVLLVGMRMPPNYGPAYVQRFDASFAEVANARKTALVPFLFEGFADNEAMFQADRIHPRAGGAAAPARQRVARAEAAARRARQDRMSERRDDALRVDVGALAEFADRIDVRSPAEFALDHVPRRNEPSGARRRRACRNRHAVRQRRPSMRAASAPRKSRATSRACSIPISPTSRATGGR